MRRVISSIMTIIFLWAIFVCVEYFRSYRGEEKLLLTINTEITDKYTKRTGLGFSIIDYNVTSEELTDGVIINEFYLLGFRVSKTIAVQ